MGARAPTGSPGSFSAWAGSCSRSSLRPWVDGELTAQTQDDSLATVTGKLEREDGQADWTLSAEVLDRRRRAFTPWPGLYTYWNDDLVKLLETAPLPARPDFAGRAGTVIAGPAEAPLAVVTGDGLLGVCLLQLAGRRAVTAREFLSGFPSVVGATFR